MKAAKITIILLVLTALGLQPGAAQQYFNKRYTLHSAASIITSAVPYHDKYYTSAISLDSSNYDAVSGGFFNIWGIRFTSYDKNGNILKDTVYQRKDRKYIDAWSNNMSVLPDGTFLVSACSADTALKYGQYIAYTNIVQFDSLGNVLMYKEYERPYCTTFDDAYHNIKDFKQDRNGNWLILSSVICNKSVVFCLRKLNNEFNEVWVKTFKPFLGHHIPAQLLVEDDGYVMTGGVDNGNTKTHPDYYTSVLIKCDTGGNVLWDWTNKFDTAHLQYIINDIIRTKDGGYVYCGSGEGKPARFGTGEWSDIYTKGWIEKLDASRNSVWKRALGSLAVNVGIADQTVLKELPDGDIMVAGGDINLLDKDDSSKGGWPTGSLARLNGTDGSVKWQRKYFSPDGNDTMSLKIYDMRQTADGGYILAGESRNNIDRVESRPIQRGWLVKVDSNGCLGPDDPQCKPVSVSPVVKSSDVFKVYPNPSAGSFSISSATQKEAFSSSVLNAIVYDLLGRPIHKESLHIQTGNTTLRFTAPDGFYVLQLTDTEGKTHREKIEVRN